MTWLSSGFCVKLLNQFVMFKIVLETPRSKNEVNSITLAKDFPLEAAVEYALFIHKNVFVEHTVFVIEDNEDIRLELSGIIAKLK